jgi:hypothetical protein
MNINISEVDTDQLRDIIEELFGVVIIQADDDDEHLLWLVEGDSPDNSVEFMEDLLSVEQQKVLETYLKGKGYA